MSEQLAQAKTPEEKRRILKQRYKETLKKDQAIIAARVQRPLSRAYKSLDLTAANEMIETEQQKAAKEYEKNKKVMSPSWSNSSWARRPGIHWLSSDPDPA